MKRNLSEAGKEEAMKKGTVMLMVEEGFLLKDMSETIEKDQLDILALLAWYNHLTEEYAKQYKRLKRIWKRKDFMKKLGLSK